MPKYSSFKTLMLISSSLQLEFEGQQTTAITCEKLKSNKLKSR